MITRLLLLVYLGCIDRSFEGWLHGTHSSRSVHISHVFSSSRHHSAGALSPSSQ